MNDPNNKYNTITGCFSMDGAIMNGDIITKNTDDIVNMPAILSVILIVLSANE